MHLLGVLFKLILFFSSCLGVWEFLRRKTNVNIYFLPVLTVAIQTMVLFCAGLLNILSEISFLLEVAGIILLIYFVIIDRGINWLKHYKKIGYIYFGIMLVAVLLTVNGKVVHHYDNFSHWALVVKQMILTDRFPNFQDTVIVYQEYPLGSAAFIYYVAKIVGVAESVWMFAQAYMITACILPVFIYVRKNKIFSLIFMFLSTNFIFIYVISITDLLVDSLLPLACMSMLLYVYSYVGKNNYIIGFDQYLSVPFMIWILQIKNAGIYFVVLVSLWVLLGIKRRWTKIEKGYIRKALLISFLPYISIVLWKKHCEYVFAEAGISYHAMTVENYLNRFNDKSLEDILTICGSWIKFCVTYQGVWLMFLGLFIGGVMCRVVYPKFQKHYYRGVLFAVVMYITYQMGTLGMYIFSMPRGEAMVLAGSTRYCKSILLAVFFVLLLLYIQIISELNFRSKKHFLAGIMAMTTVIVVWWLNSHSFNLFFDIEGDNRSVERAWVENAVKQYEIPEKASCCILVPEEKKGYLYYITRYVLGSAQVTRAVVDSMEDMEGVSDWDYLLIYDKDNPIIQEWLQDYYPDQINQNVIVREKQ